MTDVLSCTVNCLQKMNCNSGQKYSFLFRTIQIEPHIFKTHLTIMSKYKFILIPIIASLLTVNCKQQKESTQSIETNAQGPKQTYAYGYLPSTITHKTVQDSYNYLKDSLIVKCKNGYRITCDNYEQTKVESVGFGMIFTAYMEDKEIFDGMYEFYKAKTTENAKGMMAWNVCCDSIYDPGSATDGDIDVAYALIVAHSKWGGNYLEEAKKVIGVIKEAVFVICDSLIVLSPGYSEVSPEGPLWGGCELTDIQYYTPAFFRLFAQVTGDEDWNKLAEDTYILLNRAAHPETGLVPDWQDVNGKPGGNSTRCNYYSYDACRVPWRIALDYLWNGNEKANKWCDKVSTWANGVGAENIMDGYNLDGTSNNEGRHNSAFVGGFAVSAMCLSQEAADSFGAAMERLDDKYWYMACTRMLYLLAISGEFEKPIVN